MTAALLAAALKTLTGNIINDGVEISARKSQAR